MPETRERFMVLEIKVSYLEKLASELNEVVVAQAADIEALQKQLRHLEKQAEASGAGREFPHEKPPHY